MPFHITEKKKFTDGVSDSSLQLTLGALASLRWCQRVSTVVWTNCEVFLDNPAASFSSYPPTKKTHSPDDY